MMKTKKIEIYLISIILVKSILITSCKKDEINNPSNDITTAIFNTDKTYGTLKDIDGNIYKTITIGTQTWMAENLRTTHYQNGDAIPKVIDNATWDNLTTGAYCNYNNTTNLDTIATLGRLYNYYTVSDKRNISPKGWHVPTDSDWNTLTKNLGGSIAGGKLKESGLTHWLNPNGGATNETGFTALPGGYRTIGVTDNSGYLEIGIRGNWWSSTPEHYWNGNYYANALEISYDHPYSRIKGILLECGFSIRCVKD